jgi:hypothetical protein
VELVDLENLLLYLEPQLPTPQVVAVVAVLVVRAVALLEVEEEATRPATAPQVQSIPVLVVEETLLSVTTQHVEVMAAPVS